MVWVRIDDSFAQHPKVVAAGPLAMAMQVAALCYCNRNLTDGFVPWAVVPTLLSWQFLEPPNEDGRQKRMVVGVTSGMSGDDVRPEYVVGLLIAIGMWENRDGGYYIHDFDQYQPTKADVLEERRAAKERMGRVRANKGRTADEQQAKFGQRSPLPVPVPVPLDHLEGKVITTTTVPEPSTMFARSSGERAAKGGRGGRAAIPTSRDYQTEFMREVISNRPKAGASLIDRYHDIQREFGEEEALACWELALDAGKGDATPAYLKAIAERRREEAAPATNNEKPFDKIEDIVEHWGPLSEVMVQKGAPDYVEARRRRIERHLWVAPVDNAGAES